MIVIANGTDDPQKAEILDQMFQLRARQFSDRRGWRVVVEDGREIDSFDQMNPVYVCVVIGDQLVASLRLLPTIGPHMLSDVFPETMGEETIIKDPKVWESSRFCVDTNAARAFGDDGINIVTRAILAGLFRLAIVVELNNVVSVYDVFVERILRRSGCNFNRIGPVVRYDDLKTVAGLFEVSHTVVEQIISDDARVQSLVSDWHYNPIVRPDTVLAASQIA